MNSDATAPTTASPVRISPMSHSLPPKTSPDDMTPPHTVPRMTARKDSDSSTPLPRDSMREVRISGMAPYLAGTKKALCMPMRKTVDSTTQAPADRLSSQGPPAGPWLPSQKPLRATAQMRTSATFQKTREERLEKRSAR